MPLWADAVNSFIRQDYKPYYGKESTLGTFSTVGSGRSGRLKPGDPDDFLKLLEQRVNRESPSMPSRPRRAPRRATGRSAKRKAPRGSKRSIKRKAPIRKSTKRKKRKVSAKSKSVSLTVGTTRSRHVDHTSVSYTHCAYEAFSSVGAKDQFIKPIVQALLLHYMHRVGDYRNSPSVVPEQANDDPTIANPVICTWDSMQIAFVTPGVASDTDSTTVTLLTSHVVGGNTVAKTLVEMTNELATDILINLKIGRRIAQVLMFRYASSAIASGSTCILCDTNAGRNIVEVSSSALLKVQNVTLADSAADGVDSGDRCNAMNIHRNPLDGFAYTFRNCEPRFKHGYTLAKTQDEQDIIQQLSQPYSTRYAGLNAITSLPSAGSEWLVPPPAPSTIFTNFAGKVKVGVSPGSHKTFALKEFYSGPINSLFARYFPDSTGAVNPGTYPGGTSMLIGLKPKYRTSTSESIKLETEHTHTYAARMTRGKMSVLPMQTLLA